MDNFDEQVYQIVEQIPAGSVITYGEIARLMGMPGYARRVGYALGQIPAGKKVPAHRVVNSAGRLAPHWPGQKTTPGCRRRHISYKRMRKPIG